MQESHKMSFMLARVTQNDGYILRSEGEVFGLRRSDVKYPVCGLPDAGTLSKNWFLRIENRL